MKTSDTSLLCKALLILAKDRGESGDKTVEQDITHAVSVLQTLEKKYSEAIRFIKQLNAKTHAHGRQYRAECGRFLAKVLPRSK